MAVDIGTGIIRIEIDRRQLRAEALQASQTLRRTRTEITPDINTRRFVQRLRTTMSSNLVRQSWRPFTFAGVQAMDTVAVRGVAAMRLIAREGVWAAVRMRAAFNQIPILGTSGGRGAPPAAARTAQTVARAPGQQQRGLTFGSAVVAGQAGDVIGLASQGLEKVGLSAGPAALALAGLAVSGRILQNRFRRLGGFEAAAGFGGLNRATLGNLLETIGFRSAGRQQRERFDQEEADAIRQLTGDTGDLAAARAHAARETYQSATAEQRARGERERALRQEIADRLRRVRQVQQLVREGRERPGLLEAAEAAEQPALERNRAELRAIEEGRAVREASNAAVRRAADRLRVLNNQQIGEVTNAVSQQRRQNELLADINRAQRRRLRATSEAAGFDRLGEQRRQIERYRSALRVQAFEARRGAILQRRQTDSFRVTGRLVFGDSGLGVFERVTALAQDLATRLRGWAIAIGAAVVATYLLTRAAVQAEQVAAARFAAGSIAQQRVRTQEFGGRQIQGGDISQITAGIRAGADEGLSDLEVYRTAIDAIRTGSSDIFLNTEQVLGDLRVVAAATGVAFEDATQRFFRGIIKREQELLDELGIVARVEAANARYAQSINVAASQLTPYQQQLAFATEVQRQLTISAEDFGREGVRATQSVTIQVDRLGAAWSNAIAAIGDFALFRGIASLAVRFTANTLEGIRRRFGGGFDEDVGDVVQVSEVNRIESVRNQEISDRLALLSKASQAGALDIRQQENLLALQRDINRQALELATLRGATDAQGRPLIGRRNIDQAEQSQALLGDALANQRESRARSRVTAIQGPLNALLTSLEGGGRVARLSADAYEDLTRGTDESRKAIRLAAVTFGLTTTEVERLIETNRELAESTSSVRHGLEGIFEILRQEEELAGLGRFRDSGIAPRDQIAALRFNEFVGRWEGATRLMTQELETLRAAFRASGLSEIRTGALDEATAPVLSGADVGLRARPDVPTIDRAAEITLDANDRLGLAAAEWGLTLDNVQGNFRSFVQGFTTEGQSFADALGNFLRNIARSLTGSAADRLSQSLFGGILTNVTGGAGAPGGGNVNIDEVNQAAGLVSETSRINEFYEGAY